MAEITEIAPDIFRVEIYSSAIGLSFSHFVVRDEHPLLFHAGMRGMFDEVKDAVASIVPVDRLRHVGFSHFESDECGALNHWLTAAPHAQAFNGEVGAAVNLQDFAIRSPMALAPDNVLTTGQRSFRLLPTPHLPHGWDSTMLFEQSTGTLFVSDLFAHAGRCEPLIESGLADRARTHLLNAGPGAFGHVSIYNEKIKGQMDALADLEPTTLAVMHGSSFTGSAGNELSLLSHMMSEIFGAERTD